MHTINFDNAPIHIPFRLITTANTLIENAQDNINAIDLCQTTLFVSAVTLTK